jgi:LmbE family N-acetylglucosaminyl deacetylase
VKEWIFLSAHFDDVVLSVGGLVWELANRGDRVEIWTICAGDLPSDRPLTEYAQLLHGFWGIGDDVPVKRSREDAACCRVLGVSACRRYTVPDNIYRYLPGTDEPVVKAPQDNLGPLEPSESYLIPPVAGFLRKNLPEGRELVVPLAVGHHRDHVLTRKAAEQLGIPLWHYVDYPYMIQGHHDVADWVPAGAEEFSVQVSPAGPKAWQDAFACHRSQIILFWNDEPDMRASIEEYCQTGFGSRLWRF